MTIANALLDGQSVDIHIAEGFVVDITPHSPCAADIDAHGLSVFPGLHNMHSHAPMTLFRGLGDDKPLDVWLNDYIWPAEQRLTDELVYRGTLQACHEMLASGTTYFNDMYFRLPAMARAVAESGIKAQLGLNVFGNADELDEATTDLLLGLVSSHINVSIAPHSIYTVTPQGLLRCAEVCKRHGLTMHIHMNETEKEVADCMAAHGCRPWELLEQIGVLDILGNHIIAAHCLHMSDNEINLVGRYGITCVHCPNSNLKLGSGYRFPLLELLEAGATVAYGTDGSASSNNLDMIEVMKTAALLQKGWRQDATVLPSATNLGIATGGCSLSINQPADLFLTTARSLSDLIYASHGEQVCLTMVDGQVVYTSASL